MFVTSHGRKVRPGSSLNISKMAKFTPGAIVSEVRNKIAATVFTRNRAGATIRNRVTPINRRSNTQTGRRQILASFAAQWRGLSQAQRDGWIAAAQNFPRQDNLGQTIIPSGEQLYVEFNANLQLAGQSPISDAPAPSEFAVLSITSVTADAGVGNELDIAFTPTVPTGYSMIVRATRQVSPGRQFMGPSDFRFLAALAASTTSPQDVLAEYTARFGALIEGQKLFVELFLINNATGQAGQKVRAETIVIATS